jgi:TRAP-type C4-dicarboxylate transport system permease small subunit
MIVHRRERTAADRSVLNSLSLVLRIALGGLAGIIIGWFWVSGAIGAGPSVPHISSIPFGMAFLAGFSIETLFSIFDRLNRTIENREPKKA